MSDNPTTEFKPTMLMSRDSDTAQTNGITGWGIKRFDPDCPTCVWLNQHRDGKATKDHFCGSAFSRDIHNSQISDEEKNDAG